MYRYSSILPGLTRQSLASRRTLEMSGAFRVVFGCLLGAAIAFPIPSPAAVEVVPLVKYLDPSPDGDGAFGSFLDYGVPCINDDSQVAFSADLQSTSGGTASDELMVRVESDGTVTILAREGAAIMDGTGFYDNLDMPWRRYVMNNEGRVAFVCEMTGTPGGTADNQALYSTDGPGTEVEHARIGDLAGTTGLPFVGLYPPTINNQAPVGVAFYAHVGGTSSHPAYIFTNTGGTTTQIAKITDPVPEGGGTLWQFDEGQPVSIEPDGMKVTFRAQLTGTPFASEDDAAVYTGRGGALTKIARGRESVPGGGKKYDEFYDPKINVLGNVAFRVWLRPTSDGEAIVIMGGDGEADLVVMTNDHHPDGISQFSSLYSPALSAGNVAAFRANLKNTPGGGTDDEGIYRGDGTLLYECAREGQTVPEGGGKFASFGSTVAINAQAQVLFYATLRETTYGAADNHGLYLWDEVDGLTKLIRTRDTVPGSGGVVAEIFALSAGDFGGFRSLNDASEAVALLDLTGTLEKDGVYLFRAGGTSQVDGGVGTNRIHVTASPNPWSRGPLTLRWSIAAPGSNRFPLVPTRIDVFDNAGRRVWNATAETPEAGLASLEWNGLDPRGNRIATGSYLVRLRSGNLERSVRIVHLVGR